MVWSGIFADMKSNFVVIEWNITVQLYVKTVLTSQVVPFCQQNPQLKIY